VVCIVEYKIRVKNGISRKALSQVAAGRHFTKQPWRQKVWKMATGDLEKAADAIEEANDAYKDAIENM